MKKLLMSSMVATILLATHLYGGSSGFSSFDIDKTMESTKEVLKKVDKSYNIIENSATGKTVYTVLDKYNGEDEAKLGAIWFRMATQLTSNRSMAFLINNSSYKVKALLSKLSLLKKNPLTREDRTFIFKKIDYLVDRTAIDKPKELAELHKATKNLFIRSMPIVNRLTKKKHFKKFIVLKKGESFKLLYKLHYNNKNGYLLRWGFIERLNNHQQGWVNLNTINII